MLSFEPNARFGKYRILREVGRGGMGVVFKAKDVQLDRTVALKLLHPAFAADREFTKRFRAEARAIAALNHPGIVHIHTLDETDGLTVIDMEYLPNGSMLDRLGWPAMSVGETVLTSAEVLHALASCHAAGIVHRDIKPSNILFSADDRAVLTDFGLAKCVGSEWTGAAGHSATGSVAIGTPVYMPPEAWDDAQPDPGWDLYATGVVMYQAIARKTPVNAVTARGVVKELSTAPTPQLRAVAPQVSPALNDLVFALTARNPTERVKDAAEALERLRVTTEYQRAMAGQSTPRRLSITALPRRARLRRFTRRVYQSPAAKVLAACLLLAFMLGSIAVSSWRYAEGIRANAPEPKVSEPVPAPPSLPGELEIAAKNRGMFHSVYDTVIAETGNTYKHHLAVRLRAADEKGVLLGKTSKKLWYVQLKRKPEDRLSMNGHWAHYEGVENRFRHGFVEGEGQFTEPTVLLARLTFTDAESGEVFTRTFTANRSQEAVTDTKFLLEAERVNELQPLIYNELLPRRMDWALELEQVFPAINGMRMNAPFVPIGVPLPEIDGHLDDTFWDYPDGARINRVGLVLGEPGALPPELNARFTADALFLSIRVLEPLDPRTTGIDVALGRRLSIPTWKSERWMYCHRGNATPYALHRVEGTDVPWSGNWVVETSSNNTQWTAEVCIPYHSIGLEQAPSIDDRWRLNVAVHDLSGRESEQRYQWGYPIALRIEHGVILQVLEALPS